MISISAKAITHQRLIGGLGIATVTVRKSADEHTKYFNVDFNYGPLKHINRSLKGKLCSSCESCADGICWFAFPKYPMCYLARVQ